MFLLTDFERGKVPGCGHACVLGHAGHSDIALTVHSVSVVKGHMLSRALVRIMAAVTEDVITAIGLRFKQMSP